MLLYSFGSLLSGNSFQCPCGLEMLRSSLFFRVMYLIVSMPLRAWNVTQWRRWYIGDHACFNALAGLKCYLRSSSNINSSLALFQCPCGLEMLRQNYPIFFNFQGPFNASFLLESMHSFLWIYINTLSNIFQPIFWCEFPGIFLGTCLSHFTSGWLLKNFSTQLSRIFFLRSNSFLPEFARQPSTFL